MELVLFVTKKGKRSQSLDMVRRWPSAGLEKEPSSEPNHADTLILNLHELAALGL